MEVAPIVFNKSLLFDPLRVISTKKLSVPLRIKEHETGELTGIGCTLTIEPSARLYVGYSFKFFVFVQERLEWRREDYLTQDEARTLCQWVLTRLEKSPESWLFPELLCCIFRIFAQCSRSYLDVFHDVLQQSVRNVLTAPVNSHQECKRIAVFLEAIIGGLTGAEKDYSKQDRERQESLYLLQKNLLEAMDDFLRKNNAIRFKLFELMSFQDEKSDQLVLFAKVKEELSYRDIVFHETEKFSEMLMRTFRETQHMDPLRFSSVDDSRTFELFHCFPFAAEYPSIMYDGVCSALRKTAWSGMRTLREPVLVFGAFLVMSWLSSIPPAPIGEIGVTLFCTALMWAFISTTFYKGPFVLQLYVKPFLWIESLVHTLFRRTFWSREKNRLVGMCNDTDGLERVFSEIKAASPLLPMLLTTRKQDILPQTLPPDRSQIFLGDLARCSTLLPHLKTWRSEHIDRLLCELTVAHVLETDFTEPIRNKLAGFFPFDRLQAQLVKRNSQFPPGTEVTFDLLLECAGTYPREMYHCLIDLGQKQIPKTRAEISTSLFFIYYFSSTSEKFKRECNLFATEARDKLIHSMNSLVELGSLLVIVCVLEEHWTVEDLNEIKEGLRRRRAAERYFVTFFDQHRLDEPVNQEFRLTVEKLPAVFFYVFMKMFQYHASTQNSQKQQDTLRLLIRTLHQVNGLRVMMSNEGDSPFGSFRGELRDSLELTKEYIPRRNYDDLVVLFTRPWEETITLCRDTAVISLFRNDDVVSTKYLSEGGQANVALVRVPKIPVELVAKYFTGGSFNEVSLEIECLLKFLMQYNPQVVHLYGYIVSGDTYLGFLMEHCRGGSLQAIIESEEEEYGEADILNWSVQAASGLSFLLDNGIIHRDVKPPNMLLDYERRLLKISDLGISKLAPMDESHHPSGNIRGTCTTYGTPGYSAPEMSESGGYSGKIDVFGLGRSIWQMIFRWVPNDGLVDQTVDMWPDVQVERDRVDVSNELWGYTQTMMDAEQTRRPAMAECYTFLNEQHLKHPEASVS